MVWNDMQSLELGEPFNASEQYGIESPPDFPTFLLVSYLKEELVDQRVDLSAAWQSMSHNAVTRDGQAIGIGIVEDKLQDDFVC
jgi:hypothetical protein